MIKSLCFPLPTSSHHSHFDCNDSWLELEITHVCILTNHTLNLSLCGQVENYVMLGPFHTFFRQDNKIKPHTIHKGKKNECWKPFMGGDIPISIPSNWEHAISICQFKYMSIYLHTHTQTHIQEKIKSRGVHYRNFRNTWDKKNKINYSLRVKFINSLDLP